MAIAIASRACVSSSEFEATPGKEDPAGVAIGSSEACQNSIGRWFNGITVRKFPFVALVSRSLSKRSLTSLLGALMASRRTSQTTVSLHGGKVCDPRYIAKVPFAKKDPSCMGVPFGTTTSREFSEAGGSLLTKALSGAAAAMEAARAASAVAAAAAAALSDEFEEFEALEEAFSESDSDSRSKWMSMSLLSFLFLTLCHALKRAFVWTSPGQVCCMVDSKAELQLNRIETVTNCLPGWSVGSLCTSCTSRGR
mmetsp:Transcript_18871/g.40548  ORF Transcript_18871/g.40548 Transcript_18871/m.40548 type:complete len:253 (-) Transcript_18871:632-1390(-)